MASKKTRIAYSRERALHSDTLPFEIPPTFSNKDLYKFLVSNDVHEEEENLCWYWKSITLDAYIKLLIGIDQDEPVSRKTKVRSGKMRTYSYLKRPSYYTKPFTFKISHKESSFRSLSIPHPKTQFAVVNFYDKYKDTIIYYSNLDSFSLRKPCRVASHIYYSDRLHIDRFDRSSTEIEVDDYEYENLKSYFVYRKYSNIHKFYESFEFHRYEKKYNNLLKLDISNCFDSIYSHSITWAIYGKETVKEMFLEPGAKKPIANTFSDKFDRLMQSLNGRETNGIIIGPEISRIFAELILQRIDRNTLRSINSCKDHPVRYEDFDIVRYMDDYFVFYNKDSTKKLILGLLQKELQEYKFHLNSQKAKVYEKPIITEITIAKNRVTSLLDSTLKYNLKREDDDRWTGRITFPSKKLITEFKTVIKESNVQYKDLLNWTLSLIEAKLDKVFRDFEKIEETPLAKREINELILNLNEFVFFIYSVTPRVNTTLRLCRILEKIKLFIDSRITIQSFKHTVFRQIQENILYLLQKFRHSELTQVETLYLLLQLAQLDNYYAATEAQLCDYFSIDITKPAHLEATKNLNHFAITVLLSYIRNKKRYSALKKWLESLITLKLGSTPSLTKWDAEYNLLLLDSLSCPYLSNKLKRKLLRDQGINSRTIANNILADKQNWFTNWRGFEMRLALDAKRSLEVY